MTDREFDILMKKALAPEEAPPELNITATAPKHKRVLPTLVAACLCLLASAGVAIHYAPSFHVKNAAAPESAYDNLMSTDGSYTGNSFNNYGDIADQIHDNVNDPYQPEQEKSDPSSPAALPDYGAVGSPLLIPYATAKEQGIIREEAENRLGAGELKYTLMGKTDRWLSVKVANATDSVYLNLDRRSQTMATLEDMLEDESLTKGTTENEFASYGTKNYVNFDGELVIEK